MRGRRERGKRFIRTQDANGRQIGLEETVHIMGFSRIRRSISIAIEALAPCLAILGLAAALPGCGSGLDQATATSLNAASLLGSTTSAAPLVAVSPVQTVRASVAPTDLSFIRYDIAAGLSYSYGFSIGNYDGTGRPAISYFDSYGSGRARLRTATGAIGHVMYNDGENDIIIADETFPDLSSGNADEFLLEREVPIDVNGDGKMDIVGVSNSHSAVVAYINPGTHNTPWGRRVLSSVTPGPVNLTVADVNGDGLPDIIVAMRYQPDSNPAHATVGIAWLQNTGKPTGEWIYHPIDTVPGNFKDPRTLQAGDINKDGKIDVVVSDSVTGQVAWYQQLSPVSWARHTIPGVDVSNAHFGRVLDMDGDGSLDILLPVDKGVSWLRNVNNGASWEVHPIVQFTDSDWANIVTEVVAGDVHHDGTLDVVFSVGELSGGYSTVRSGGVYIAHPSGYAWTLGKVYQTENNVCCLDLIDFDSTGVWSIVSNAEYQQNGITVWQNQLGLP